MIIHLALTSDEGFLPCKDDGLFEGMSNGKYFLQSTECNAITVLILLFRKKPDLLQNIVMLTYT